MRPARLILAVFVGYLSLLLLELIGGMMLAGALGNSPERLLIPGEILTFLCGLVAGLVTARLAPARPLMHAGVAAFVIIFVTAISTAFSRRPVNALFPSWYPYAAALLTGAGVFVGGALLNKETPPA